MPDSTVSLDIAARDDATARLERATEQLAVLLAYGNDDERAEQARAEIAAAEAAVAALEPPAQPAAKPTRRGAG